MKPVKYRKVSEAAFVQLRDEAHKRLAVKPYKQIARDLDLPLRAVQQVVSRMMRDIEQGRALVYGGGPQVDVAALEMELHA